MRYIVQIESSKYGFSQTWLSTQNWVLCCLDGNDLEVATRRTTKQSMNVYLCSYLRSPDLGKSIGSAPSVLAGCSISFFEKRLIQFVIIWSYERRRRIVSHNIKRFFFFGKKQHLE